MIDIRLLKIIIALIFITSESTNTEIVEETNAGNFDNTEKLKEKYKTVFLYFIFSDIAKQKMLNGNTVKSGMIFYPLIFQNYKEC